MNFYINKKRVKEALKRGAHFEINYGSSMLEPMTKESRKFFIANSIAIINLLKRFKGMGVILSSNVNRKIFMRAPLDIVQLCQLFGLNPEEARKTLTDNCVRVFKNAHRRKTFEEGHAEVQWLTLKELKLVNTVSDEEDYGSEEEVNEEDEEDEEAPEEEGGKAEKDDEMVDEDGDAEM